MQISSPPREQVARQLNQQLVHEQREQVAQEVTHAMQQAHQLQVSEMEAMHQRQQQELMQASQQLAGQQRQIELLAQQQQQVQANQVEQASSRMTAHFAQQFADMQAQLQAQLNADRERNVSPERSRRQRTQAEPGLYVQQVLAQEPARALPTTDLARPVSQQSLETESSWDIPEGQPPATMVQGHSVVAHYSVGTPPPILDEPDLTP